MKTRCNKCKKLINYGNSLCEDCKSKIIKNNKKFLKDKDADKLLKSSKWQNKRNEILLRDKGVCQLCFRRDKYINNHELQVHHIVKRTVDKTLAFDNNNLITVCRICHEEIEKLSPADQRTLLKINEIKEEKEFFL